MTRIDAAAHPTMRAVVPRGGQILRSKGNDSCRCAAGWQYVLVKTFDSWAHRPCFRDLVVMSGLR